MTTVTTPDLQSQIVRIIYSVVYSNKPWEQKREERCESAADQIIALLKPQARVDREKRPIPSDPEMAERYNAGGER